MELQLLKYTAKKSASQNTRTSGSPLPTPVLTQAGYLPEDISIKPAISLVPYMAISSV